MYGVHITLDNENSPGHIRSFGSIHPREEDATALFKAIEKFVLDRAEQANIEEAHARLP